MSLERFEVLIQANAHEHLTQIEFVEAWTKLYEHCDWATGYQSPEYCATWYHLFEEKFSPILLLAYDERGELIGLFALARSLVSNDIVIAGNQHPEYRIWLALAENHQSFVKYILKWLQQHCPNPLDFAYVPHNFPLNYLVLEPDQSNQLRIGDANWLNDYINNKKRLKTKFNKIKRMGEVEFKRITDPKEFEPLLEQIIPLYEFRQGAVHRAMPFHINPLKRAFTLELVAQQRLHATVLTINGQVLSALLCVHGHGKIHLGEIAYSVFHSEVSPGLIHLWLLIQLLAKEGFQILDLTPGGDDYKSRVSSDIITPYHLVFYPRMWQGIYHSGWFQTKKYLKKIKGWLNTQFNRNQVEPKSTDDHWTKRLLEIAFLPKGRATQPFISETIINKNSADDLLLFKPETGSQEDYFDFLAFSLNWIHRGAEVYTLVENDQLRCAVWVIEDIVKYIPQIFLEKQTISTNDIAVVAMYPVFQEDSAFSQKILNNILSVDKNVYIFAQKNK